MGEANHEAEELRELRFYDPRLSRLPDAESRFYAASKLVEYVTQKSGARVISWCVEGQEIIILAEGGDLKHFPRPRPGASRRDELLAAAKKELQRAKEYEQASFAAPDQYATLGYLDLAREAKEAAAALTREADAWGEGGSCWEISWTGPTKTA